MEKKNRRQSSDAPLLRKRAEELLRANASDVPTMFTADVQALVHELNVHQMELEIQNEELRNAQVELAETRDRYVDLYEFAPVGYLSLDHDAVIRDANLTAAKLLNRERSALIGHRLSGFVTRESQDNLHLHWHEALESGSRACCEVRITRPDGSPLDVQLDIVVRVIEEPADIRVAITDITRRKQADETLLTLNKELERRVTDQTGEIRLQAEALANLGEGVLITKADLNWPGPHIIFVNSAMCQITGYTADELNGQSPRILQGNGSDRETINRIKAELSAGRSCEAELVNYRKNGMAYDAELFVTPLFDADGRPTNFVSIQRDITKRKRAERDLRDAESLNKAILASLPAHIAVVDRTGTIVSVNPSWKEFAMKNGEIADRCGVGANYLEVCRQAGDQNGAVDTLDGLKAVLDGTVDEFSREYPYHSPDERRWFLLHATRLRGGITGAVVSHINITERIQAEEAMRESERAFVTLINNLPGAAYRCRNDKDWTVQYMSDGIYHLTGFRTHEFTEGSVKFGDLIHVDDQESVWNAVQTAISKRNPFETVYRLMCRDRRTKTVWERGEGVFSQEGELLALEGFITDISDLKEAEEALRTVYEFNENLIETAQNIILVLDPEGRVARFNPAFAKLSGWNLDEAEGCDWFETFLPERDRRRIKQLFAAAISGRPTPGNVNPILRKDGGEREIEWYDALLKDSSGKLIGLLCTGIDVTDRLRLEQEVVNASEEERQRIAQDLHDDLGSHLTGVDFRLKALTTRLLKQGNEKEADYCRAVQNLVQDAVRKTRCIAKGLHAVGGHPEDLKAALKEMVESIRDTSNTHCQLRCPQPVLIPDSILSNQLYRIAQEAINNAVKHSESTRITVSLSESEDKISLSVTDNGTGFDRLEHGSQGLGLHIMKYRTAAIGGFLNISRRKSGGTKVVCKIPSEPRRR